MATSISCGFAFWMDGASYDGAAGRTFDVAPHWFSYEAANVLGGVLPCGGSLWVTAGSGMSVNVATGWCVIPSASGSLQGAYQFGNLSSGSLSVATADPTNSRVDLVCATVTDNGNDTSTTEIQIITGEASGSPGPPDLPTNSIPLAYVTVPPLATSINSGDVSDQRTYTVGIGGVMPLEAVADAPAGYSGMYVHDLATNRLLHNPGPTYAEIEQVHILPYEPVIVASSSAVTNSGSETTVLTLTFTSDGVSNWEFTARWSGILVSSGGGTAMTATMRLRLDGNQLAVQDVYNAANDGTPRGGGTLWHVTSGTVGDTPAEGTHTLTFTFTQNYSGSSDVQVYGGASQPILLYAKPATL